MITTVSVIDEVIEYDEKGLGMMFKLNPDFIPGEITESEFDKSPQTEDEKSTEEKED